MKKIPLGLPLICLLWWLAGLAGFTNPLFLPNIALVLQKLATALFDTSLWHDTYITFIRAGTGLFLSALVGIPLGLMVGRSSAIYFHIKFLLDFIRSIPAATLFPLFILVFGIGDLSKIAVVFYGCVFIILMSAIYGGRDNPDRDRRIAGLRSLRASKFDIYRWVIIPDALGQILTGLRIAASVALILVVITEMFLGANDGLGKRIYDNYLSFSIADMYANLIVLGVLGYVFNASLEKIESKYQQRLKGKL